MRLTLQETNSEILKEWDYKKNSNSPDDVTPSSHERIWWVCNQGHSWPATVANRFRKKQGCPYCSGRLPIPGENDLFSTNPELKKEWDYVKNKHLDPAQLKANSSKEAYWICDKGHSCPYCSGKKVLTGFNDLKTVYPDIALEWDYDKNGELLPTDVHSGARKKVWWICPKGHPSYESYIYSRTGTNKTNCPVCSNKTVVSWINDLATLYPKLLKEWDYENNEKDPTTISSGSRYEAQWHCSKGHVWTEKVLLRALRNFGCPYCSRHRVIKGVNDLKTLYPQIAKEWNYSKNGQLRPENYLPKSNKEVWWINCLRSTGRFSYLLILI